MIGCAPTFILLATWNGMRHLPDQIRSLVAQHDANWRLLVRDDGSTDGTVDYLTGLAAGDPRCTLVKDDRGRIGSAASFMVLMQLALEQGAVFFALCDQDDVWRPDKLTRLRARLEGLQHLSETSPLLVWCDLRWIDGDDHLLAASHFRAAGANVALRSPGPWLLAQNLTPGCAMMGNRRLLQLACALDTTPSHHDWWIALIAACFGVVGTLDEALVDYRQHEANQIGARGFADRVVGYVARPTHALAAAHRTYWESVELAALINQLAEHETLHPDWQSMAVHVCRNLGAKCAWVRARSVLRGPVRRPGLARSLLMLLAALASPPDSVQHIGHGHC